MALVELYHVVADIYDVDSSAEITEGMVVMQNAAADIVVATGASGTVALGLAGDNKINTGNSSGLPGAADGWQNRVSDPNFYETRASGKITVYHSGGKFATDQYDSTLTFAIGDACYSDATGKLTNVASANAQVVGYCVAVPAAYPSGVPGTDINGDISLGTFMEIKLVI